VVTRSGAERHGMGDRAAWCALRRSSCMEPSRLDCACSISSHRRMYRYMDSSLSFPLRLRPASPRLVVKPPEPLALGEHRAALAPRAGID
jgi:hypothetical protein